MIDRRFMNVRMSRSRRPASSIGSRGWVSWPRCNMREARPTSGMAAWHLPVRSLIDRGVIVSGQRFQNGPASSDNPFIPICFEAAKTYANEDDDTR